MGAPSQAVQHGGDAVSDVRERSTAGESAQPAGAERPSSSSAGDGPDWEAAFLELLANRSKLEKGSLSHRQRGFVAVARGTTSLQPVQDLCVDGDRQTYNTCATLRCRLGAAPEFAGADGVGHMVATALTALALDLSALRSPGTGRTGRPATFGRMLPAPRPDPQESLWRPFIASSQLDAAVDAASLREGRRELSLEEIERFLDALGDESLLPVGRRLVVLCELESGGTPAAWEHAFGSLFPLLPERMGFVFSGVPDDVRPPDDPHYRELAVPPPSGPDGETVRFSPAALRGDRPADRDMLGLARYADALAQLVLHEGTEPLTIGVHAPWGRGKSSFLNFVGQALVRNGAQRSLPGEPRAGQRRRARLLEEIGDLERRIATAERELVAPDGEAIERQPSDTDRVRQLEVDLATLRDERRRLSAQLDRHLSDVVIRVDFNAWLYQDSPHIWAGLVRETSRQVERSLPRRARVASGLAYTAEKRGRDLVVSVAVPVVLAALLGVVLSVIGLGSAVEAVTAELPDLARIVQVLLPAGSLAVLVWFVTWRAYQILQPVSERVLEYVDRPGADADIGNQAKVIDDLVFLRERIRRPRLRWSGGRPRRIAADPRVVVFIDDLDRCANDKIMEVLQTVNLILGQSGFFVVLAIDTDKIYRAIHEQYAAKEGGGQARTTFAEQYLRKILQLSFHLPPTPSDGRAALVHAMFSAQAQRDYAMLATDGGEKERQDTGTAPGSDTFDVVIDALAEPATATPLDVPDTADELQMFHRLHEWMPDVPRELKRLVNVHRLTKILTEAPPTPEQRARLVEWLVFCARWPWLVDDVLDCAQDLPPDGDVLEHLCRDRLPDGAEAAALAGFVAVEGFVPLTGEDLQPKSPLAEAARISQLVSDSDGVATVRATRASARPMTATVPTATRRPLP